MSLFDCAISIVDEAQKDRLNRILYDRHRSELGAMISREDLVEDDDAAPISANPSGFPQPSSDRNKWWLDNGNTLI